MTRTPIGPDALLFGDSIQWLKMMPDNLFTAVITDPPYGLEFMGKEWDAPWKEGERCNGRAQQMRGFQEWCEVWGREVLRVLKPGGHLLSFGGTRTYHRMVCGIEEAGFQVRDEIDFPCEVVDYHSWVYGQGFPKSHDISKAIDKTAGAERTEVIGTRSRNVKPFDDENGWNENSTTGKHEYKAPATDDAKKWEGYGTALKPAHEPIVVFGKDSAPLNGNLFTYTPKVSTKERNLGCKNLFWHTVEGIQKPITKDEHARLEAENAANKGNEGWHPHRISQGNVWPTVKPLELMRYLVKMTKMPGDNLILDPFVGSGTTPCACILEGCNYVAIDRDPVAFRIAQHRVTYFTCLGKMGLK